MIIGPSGHVHEPQKPSLLNLDSQKYSKIQETPQITFKILFLQIAQPQQWQVFGENTCRTIFEIRRIFFENREYGIKIYQNT